MKKRITKKNSTPNKSWSKRKNETWVSYLRRILTYKRIELVIMLTTLLLAVLTFYLTFHKTEMDLLKDNIETNISTLEKQLNREKIAASADTSSYVKQINNFQIDILNYIGLWKAVSASKLSTDYADLPLNEATRILSNEFERRIQLGNMAVKLFEDIKAIRTYELLTDTSNVTKISEEKQTILIQHLTEQNRKDSVSSKTIIGYLRNVKRDSERNLNYKKDLKSAIKEMKGMTNNVLWYRYHDGIIDFALESNNLFEISKRNYKDLPPYHILNEMLLQNGNSKEKSQEKIDSVRNIILSLFTR